MQPLRFHTKHHGKNIRIFHDGTTAHRVQPGRIEGSVFSDRPVKVDEKVCLRITNGWHGHVAFGLTTQDPSYTSRIVYQHWAKYVTIPRFESDKQLYYYVNAAGQVYYGVDGVDQGLFFTGVDMRYSQWMLVNIYGNDTTVQFVDSEASNQVKTPIQSPLEERMISDIQSLSVKTPVVVKSAQFELDRLGSRTSNVGWDVSAMTNGATANKPSRSDSATSQVVGVTTNIASRSDSATSQVVGVTTNIASRSDSATTSASSQVVGVTTNIASRSDSATTIATSQVVGVTTNIASRDVGATGSTAPGRVVSAPTSAASGVISGKTITPRNTFASSDSNMQPLRFYTKNHGKNIRMSRDGSTAHRVQPGLIEGMVFSARPVKVDEKICLRVGHDWHGTIRFGFTAHDPAILVQTLTKQWAMITDILHRKYDYYEDKILYYFVNWAGQVYFGVNGEDEGCLFSGVDVQSSLWMLLEIHGNGTTVQCVDPEASNQLETPIQSLVEERKIVREIEVRSAQPKRTDRLSSSTSTGRNFAMTCAMSRAVGVTANRANRSVGATSPVGVTTKIVSRGVGATSQVVFVTTNIASRGIDAMSQVVDVTTSIQSRRDVGTTRNMASRTAGAIARADVGARTIMPSSSRIDCPNNLPPLRFHGIHGRNLRVSGDGSVAERIRPGEEGEAFSSRPVRVYEKVCIRFVKISSVGNPTIRYGFSAIDPATLTGIVSKRRRKSWVWPLAKKFYKVDNIVYYYVNAAGEVCFGINGEETGVFSSNVNVTSLWAIVHINGVGTAVQFVQPEGITRPVGSAGERMIDDTRFGSIEDPLPQLTYQGPLVPLNFHATKGRNIKLSSGFAARIEGTSSQGYAFTAHPLLPSQTIVIQILSAKSPAGRPGGLTYGLTSCDPGTLRQCDLPDYVEQLVNRPEYWVVRQHAANGLRVGDELTVTLSLNGEVQESRNKSDPITVMHVDHTLKLWAFFDLYETTQKVRMLMTQTAERPQPSRQADSTTNQLPQAQNTDTECTICLDKPVDCALYKCGHMCMCYKCATLLWKKGGGRCPICRLQINEVIRIYKS